MSRRHCVIRTLRLPDKVVYGLLLQNETDWASRLASDRCVRVPVLVCLRVCKCVRLCAYVCLCECPCACACACVCACVRTGLSV